MQIIVRGRPKLCAFWKSPSIHTASYRLMRYLIREDIIDETILLNTVTGELVLLDPTEQKLLNGLPAPYSAEMEDLIKHRFLVPVDFEELKSVNQLREIMKRVETSDFINGYTILPTTSCNARCFYCYEVNSPHYTMTPEIADKVIDYIFSHCDKEKKVTLHWFGGEPTLGEHRIDQICSGLKSKGITFYSTMISNGYLFTKEMVAKAHNNWNLQSIQITLDGTEQVYNETKSYINVIRSPYRQVLDNISLLLEQGVRVTIRMNLGFHNAENLKDLIEELGSRYSGKKEFIAYVHELFEDQGVDPKSHTIEERLRLEAIKDNLNNYILERGCNNSRDKTGSGELPSLKTFYCMADTPMSLLINPLGQFGKCEHVFFANMIGDVDVSHDFNSQAGEYWLKPTYDKTCQECALYPFCGQIENCEIKNVCYSNRIRDNKINSAKKKIRLIVEGGNSYEET